jgi:hypothetical protein
VGIALVSATYDFEISGTVNTKLTYSGVMLFTALICQSRTVRDVLWGILIYNTNIVKTNRIVVKLNLIMS